MIGTFVVVVFNVLLDLKMVWGGGGVFLKFIFFYLALQGIFVCVHEFVFFFK